MVLVGSMGVLEISRFQYQRIVVHVWFWLVARGVLENSRLSIPKDRGIGVVLVGSKGNFRRLQIFNIKRKGFRVWFWLVAMGASEDFGFQYQKIEVQGVVLVGSKGVLEISRFSISKDSGPRVVLVGSKGSYRKLQVFYTKVQLFRFGSGW